MPERVSVNAGYGLRRDPGVTEGWRASVLPM